MSGKYRRAAYAALLRHYRDVFRHYWGLRKSMGGGLLTAQEAEFLPAALALQEAPVSPASRWTARILIALIAALFIWSVLGKVDIIVNASGKIIPSERTKTISSVDIASVKALHVEEGQSVKAGDVLIELDSSVPDAQHAKAAGDEEVALLLMARSRALIVALEKMVPPQLPKIAGITKDRQRAEQSHLDGQYRDLLAKLGRIDGDIQRYREALPLAVQTAEDYRDLLKDHDVSTHAYLEKEQSRIALEGQLREAGNQRVALIEEARRQAYDSFSDAGKLAAESEQDALSARSHSRLLTLVAPVDGTVQQLTAHTIGGVVPAAQPLMEIVPAESHVEVEASLENKDIGFVEEGQSAEVKIDAFEYTKFGTIPARVSHVSRDAINDEKRGLLYTSKIALQKSSILVDGRQVPLIAGMSVSVEIKTGTRRVIEYVLGPLLQHKRESLNER